MSGEFSLTQITTEISSEICEVPESLIEGEQTVARACSANREIAAHTNLRSKA